MRQKVSITVNVSEFQSIETKHKGWKKINHTGTACDVFKTKIKCIPAFLPKISRPMILYINIWMCKSVAVVKKRLRHKCFPVNFAKFLRIILFYKTPLVAVSGNKSSYCNWYIIWGAPTRQTSCKGKYQNRWETDWNLTKNINGCQWIDKRLGKQLYKYNLAVMDTINVQQYICIGWCFW